MTTLTCKKFIAALVGEPKTRPEIIQKIRELYGVNITNDNVRKRILSLKEDGRIFIEEKRRENNFIEYNVIYVDERLLSDGKKPPREQGCYSVSMSNKVKSAPFTTPEIALCQMTNRFNTALRAVRGSASL